VSYPAYAFGLRLSVGFDVPGLARTDDGIATTTVLERIEPAELAAAWPAHGGTVLLRQRMARRREPMTLAHDPGAGYLLTAPGFGAYLLAGDGARISCAPPDVAAWRWQRFLTGQVLPLAAVLAGLEVFHASAIALDGQVTTFFANSGVGKTSLALNLVLRGAALVTDDVLAIDAAPGDGAPLVHPGVGLANVRHAELGALRAAGRRLGGPALGRDGKGARVRLGIVQEPQRLATVAFLERAPAGEPLVIEPVTPEPPRLLSATFNFVIRTPARMISQLDVCSRIADTTRLLRVRFPPDVDAAALAERLEPVLRAERDGTPSR
jgi:hypothetical protein